MIEKRNPNQAIARNLYAALADLMEKITEHCPDIPDSVKSSLVLANFELLRARMENKKHDT